MAAVDVSYAGRRCRMWLVDRLTSSFWRPNIWDLIGVGLGAVGLFLTGTVIVSLSLNAVHIVEIVGAVLLVAGSALIVSRYRESSAYPFTVHCMESTIVFSMDPASKAPIGRLSRKIEMSLRSNSPDHVDRFVWLTDHPTVTEPAIRSRLELKATLETGNGNISRLLTPKIKLSEFRKLEMSYALPDEAKQFRRFRIVETFVLPNEFPAADEYYDTTIQENAKRRIVRFEFHNDMNLAAARFAIVRGKRAPIYHGVDIKRDNARAIAFIEREFGRLRVGDILSFRWNWNFHDQGKAAAGGTRN